MKWWILVEIAEAIIHILTDKKLKKKIRRWLIEIRIIKKPTLIKKIRWWLIEIGIIKKPLLMRIFRATFL